MGLPFHSLLACNLYNATIRVIVFEGSPSVETTANSPQSLLSGMNKFLEQLKVTFRWDQQLVKIKKLLRILGFRMYEIHEIL